MGVLGPTEPSDLTSKDVAVRSRGRDTPEITSRDAGRESPGTARWGSRCPGSRRARETRVGKARSCLPTRLLHSTPFHFRPFQKATNPTATGAGSPQACQPAYRRLLPSFPSCLRAGIYLKGMGHYVYA